jgi:ubiquinol-cytochrome c reductase cytochrome b subunit
LAISEYLSLTQKIHQDKTNCFKVKVSSARSIENIVKFLHKAPVKLQGYKKLQYLLWLKELRHITRYTEKFNIPDIY